MILINLTATIKAPKLGLFRIEHICYAPNGSDLFQAVDPFRRPHPGSVDVVVVTRSATHVSATHVNAGPFEKVAAGLDEAASAGGRREPPIPGRRRRRTKEERCKHLFHE